LPHSTLTVKLLEKMASCRDGSPPYVPHMIVTDLVKQKPESSTQIWILT